MESDEQQRRKEIDNSSVTEITRRPSAPERETGELRLSSRFWVPWSLAASALMMLFVLGWAGDCTGL